MTSGPSDVAALRRDVVAACRHLAGRGLSPGSSGNVSVRVGDVLLVTPTGSSLTRVTEDDLAVVPLHVPPSLPSGDGPAPGSGSAGQGPGGPRPSKEMPLHRAVYERRPAARAVVHLHSPYATAAACLEPDDAGHAPLPPLTPYGVMRLGEVPVAPYARPGTPELAEGVRRLAAHHHVLLLANHGSVVAADSLDAATDLAEELEAAAQLTLLLRGTAARTLRSADVQDLRAAR